MDMLYFKFGLLVLPVILAGVCEELKIPMDTVEVPGIGSVCKVRECETVTYNEHGKPTCVSCSQEGFDPDNKKPTTEFCPLEIGKCQAGHCVTRTESNYFENNFGKRWEGLKTFSAITATHYGGDMACGGYGDGYNDLEAIELGCATKVGIDGFVAVPALMFGYDATAGQACYKNNDLCYRLVGIDNVTRIVAVVDRCGGYTQCSGSGIPDIRNETPFIFPPQANAPGATVWADANACQVVKGAKIHVGLGQRCWYYTDGGVGEAKAICCPGTCGKYIGDKVEQVDWCGSSSHPHFDMSRFMLDALCDNGRGGGIQAGSCQLIWVEPIKCPVHPVIGKCCKGSCSECKQTNSGNCMDSAEACQACGGVYCGGDQWHNICTAPQNQIPTPYPGFTPRPTDPPVEAGAGSRAPTARPPPEEGGSPFLPTTIPGTTNHPETTTTTHPPTQTTTTNLPTQTTTTHLATQTQTTGQTGTLPGQTGTLPGQTGTLPGQTGTLPGQMGTLPGQTDHTFTEIICEDETTICSEDDPNCAPEKTGNMGVVVGSAIGGAAAIGAAAYAIANWPSTPPEIDMGFEGGDDMSGDEEEREALRVAGSGDFEE